MAKDNRKEYLLISGFHSGIDADGNRHEYVAGEKDNNKVLLRDDQYLAFKDKFKSVAQLRAEARAASGEDDEIDEGNEKAPIEKPNPTPSVGTAEPAPKGVTPAPVGSAANPVNPAAGEKK